MDDYRRQTTPTFGEVIRQRRIELGLTQEELAERVGESVRQSDISRMERDYVTLPRRDRLEALAAALDVTPGYLLMHSGWITGDEISILEPSGTPGYPEPVESHSDVDKMPDEAMGAPITGTEDPDREPLPAEPLSPNLIDAIARARQVSRETEELLQRTSSTMQNARRSRRVPE